MANSFAEIEKEYSERKKQIIYKLAIINGVALFLVSAIIPTGFLEKIVSAIVLAYLNYDILEKELLG